MHGGNKGMILSSKQEGGDVHQGNLEKVVRKLFPKEELVKNVRKEANISSSNNTSGDCGTYLELDVWLPKLKICFEFQDPYHYIETWDSHVPLLVRQEVDYILAFLDVKKEAVLRRKETLITVPCWWDGDHESVAADIQFQRPELLVSTKDCADDVIPLNPDSEYFKKRIEGSLHDIGDLMLASFPLGVAFTTTITPENPWWMGEKYDGCRACWNPKKHVLLSRSGNVIGVPANMISNFENLNTFLDGEIWIGRGDPIDAIRLAMDECDVNWALVRRVEEFAAFDNPSPRLHRTAFEKRYASLLSAVGKDHPFVIIAQRSLCANGKQLIKITQELIEEGGEGVILRRPGSLYVRGRSKHLIKFKASREDKEALVMDLKGGSCMLQLPDLSTFSVPVESISCKMPKSGDIVSFSFQSYSAKAIPVKPEIFRIRGDLTWEGVVQEYEREAQLNAANEKEFSSTLNESSKKHLGWKPSGYWSDEAGKKKMRAIMENFAKNELRIDPLVPAGWYIQKRSELMMKNIEVSKIVTKHSGSLVKTLKNLFPEIAFDDSKFNFSPQNFWAVVDNRRQFMIRFAKQEGFDPYVADNWYSVSQDRLLSQKGGRSFLFYYSNSPFFAAMHLFPEIGIDVTKFTSVPNVHNRRHFFEQVAHKRGFDPLIADNWYTVPNIYMLNLKSASSILAYYNGNFEEALVKLFPDVKFDMRKFSVRKYENSGDVAAKRKFFLDFAASNGFNPFVQSCWYTVSSAQILQVKGGAAILQPYGGNYGKALAHLFPDIGFDETKFGALPQNYWESAKNRRGFFEHLAKQRSMDPLSPATWYTFPLYRIKYKKHSSRVLAFHNKKIADALMDLFPDIKLDKSKFQQFKDDSESATQLG